MSVSLPSSIVELMRAGDACADARELPAALQEALQAFEIAQALADAEDAAVALVAVARLRFRLGQYEAAQNDATDALQISPLRSPICADAWQVLGNCAADTGSLAQAEACYRTAADLARETGYHRARAAALQGLGGASTTPAASLILRWQARAR